MMDWEKIWENADVHTTVHELLERTRVCRGIALDVCNETMTFPEFHERSDRFAAWLQAQGYGRKDIIIVSMKASANLFCMIAAALKAGVILTVTEDDVTEVRLQKLIDQTKAVARITDAQIPEILRESEGLPLEKITDRIRPEDVYAIWYTSGSTGEPCGIQTVSYNIVCTIAPVPGNEIMSGCLKESCAFLNLSHPSFGMGFTNFFYAILYGKKFVHIQPGREDTIRQIARKMRENKGCFLLFTPSGMSACLRDEEARESLKNVASVMMGADIVKSSLIDEVQEVLGPQGKVINLYGSSDVGLCTAKIARKDDKPHAVGKPVFGTEVCAVDEDRNPLKPGEPGELRISGLRVGPGYLCGAPERMNKFVHGKDGVNYFFIGDYGRVDEDGEVYLLGRMDRRIKHLGYPVDGVEVEETIRREVGVKAVAVKQFDTERGQVLCAFYESEQELDPNMIRDKIASALPRYCIPERYVCLSKLPLTERGKLDYKALTLSEEETGPRKYVAPRNEKERTICEAFEKCLKTKAPVGIDDSFFELGGDSLSGTVLLRVLGENGLHYTLEELFSSPRPCDLALCSSENREEDAGEDAPLPLPDELAGLRASENTEEILPPEVASSFYLFVQESGSAYERGLRVRLRFRLNHSFSEEAFQNRIRRIADRHPALRSRFIKDSTGKRWQIFEKEQQPPVFYRDIAGLSEEARERFLSGFFAVMEENDVAFQAGCFPVGEGCEILLCMTHAIADGVSTVILINEVAGEQEPSGTDRFYDYRKKRLARRERFPEELETYYASFTGGMLLPANHRGHLNEVERRELTLSAEETEELKERCGRLGISLPAYVEYSYGKGLLAAMGRDAVWFSHLYSGRDMSFDGADDIVGNLIYTMPVYLDKDMSPETFKQGVMKPWKYPFVTDTKEYGRLNRHNIEEGIISRIFEAYHGNVLSVTNGPEGMDTGHYMEMADGALRIVLRYPRDEGRSLAYETVMKTMEQYLKGRQNG